MGLLEYSIVSVLGLYFSKDSALFQYDLNQQLSKASFLRASGEFYENQFKKLVYEDMFAICLGLVYSPNLTAQQIKLYCSMKIF